MAQPQAEKASYLVSEHLNFFLAPAAKDTTLKLKGVFQLFISKEKESHLQQVQAATQSLKESGHLSPKSLKYVEAAAVIDNFKAEKFTDGELTLFQKFAIFDYLIGNLDRHEENWLVIFDAHADGTKTLKYIKAIDNANAFPKKHPKPFTKKVPSGLDLLINPARNQYKWKNLNIARFTFTAEIKEFVKNNLSSEKIRSMLKIIDREMPDFLDDSMHTLFLQRTDTLRRTVEEGKTPEQLANLPMSSK